MVSILIKNTHAFYSPTLQSNALPTELSGMDKKNISLSISGLSKKETCLCGRVAVWPFGRNYELFYEPFYNYIIL